MRNMPVTGCGRVEAIEGYQTGLIAEIVGLHARKYNENFGFGAVFERKVATEMADVMGRIDRPANIWVMDRPICGGSSSAQGHRGAASGPQ